MSEPKDEDGRNDVKDSDSTDSELTLTDDEFNYQLARTGEEVNEEKECSEGEIINIEVDSEIANDDGTSSLDEFIDMIEEGTARSTEFTSKLIEMGRKSDGKVTSLNICNLRKDLLFTNVRNT
jgi:hypothetical protein